MRYVIFNADDFGASLGINRGIVDCHRHGVVTSASLMVTGRAVHEAVALSRDCPALSLGLHWDVWGEDEREFDLRDLGNVEEELDRQVDAFHRLVGRLPTHIDSHRHAHLEEVVRDCFLAKAGALCVPVRGDGRVQFIGGFYAQWEWKVTTLEHVSVSALQRILAAEIGEGWTEVSCHPGYVSPDYQAVYLEEREAEVKTLTDPRVRRSIEDLRIGLKSYAEFPALKYPEGGGSRHD